MKNSIVTVKCIAIVAMSMLFGCGDEPEVTPQIVEEQPAGPPKTEVRISVPEEDFEIVVAEMTGKGYTPFYIDGFIHRVGLGDDSKAKTFFNIIFKEQVDTTEYKHFHGLNKSGLEASIDLLKGTHNLIFLESYRSNDEILFAAIFSTGEPTQFHTELKIPENKWQAKFDIMTGAGYRMACRTMVREGEEWFVSALFDKTPVGGWVSVNSLSPDAMTQKILEQNEKGRSVSHFDVIQQSSSQYTFGAIFDSKTTSAISVKQDMTSSELTSTIASATNYGYVLQTLSAYDMKVATGETWHFITLYIATWKGPR